jgi:hypothetical protein
MVLVFGNIFQKSRQSHKNSYSSIAELRVFFAFLQHHKIKHNYVRNKIWN